MDCFPTVPISTALHHHFFQSTFSSLARCSIHSAADFEGSRLAHSRPFAQKRDRHRCNGDDHARCSHSCDPRRLCAPLCPPLSMTPRQSRKNRTSAPNWLPVKPVKRPMTFCGDTRTTGTSVSCCGFRSQCRKLIIRLDDVIEKSTYLVGDLINFNKDQWPVRYPCLAPAQEGSRHACESPQSRFGRH